MRAAFSCAFLILLAGCASSPDHGQGNENRDVLTREEMLTTDLVNLGEVVRRLRPEWFFSTSVGGHLITLDADLKYMNRGPPNIENWRKAGVYELEFVPEEKAREALAGTYPSMRRSVRGGIIIRYRPGGGG